MSDPLDRELYRLDTSRFTAGRAIETLRILGYDGDPARFAARGPKVLLGIRGTGRKSVALIAAALESIGAIDGGNSTWGKYFAAKNFSTEKADKDCERR